MQRQQWQLAILNVLGGIAVIGSYLYAFSYSSELRSGLWGGVPEAIRPLYTVNMLLAAAGYFPFTWLFVFKTAPADLRATAGAPYGLLFALYGLVLIPSAMWLPMTAQMLLAPDAALWWGIRLVLALVGIGAAGIMILAFRSALSRRDVLCWCAAIGSVPFFTQTGILDALIWPAYYPF